MRQGFASAADVTVTTAFTTLKEVTKIMVGSQASIEIENVGAVAFSDCELQVKDHVDGEWYTIITGAEWASTSTNWIRRVGPTVPNTLGATTLIHVLIDIGAAYGIRIRAKTASSTTTANLKMTIGNR